MNQKKLKKLRKLARTVTSELPDKKLMWAAQPAPETNAQRVVNHLQTTRGTYRWLKLQENLFDRRGAFRAAGAAVGAARAADGESAGGRESTDGQRETAARLVSAVRVGLRHGGTDAGRRERPEVPASKVDEVV